MTKKVKPKILAPAGDKYSFLAAIAAGADAIYCGLKNFSARMEAGNFTIEELSRLNALARSKNVETYVAFNSLVKQNEIEQTARIIAKLAKYVRPHALIIQDIGLIEIARKAGFKGDFHLSTLGNCSFSKGLDFAEKAGFSRVVLPRELSIDEIKIMAGNRPANLELEVFIHGALCYAVSGRCYWSSWFGGRSGLRGRCVQPCRRLYKQELKLKNNTQEPSNLKHKFNQQQFFSCLDFSADVLVKVLKEIQGVTTWKIEGRKKSPHYVFYTVKAYKMLRDHGDDPSQKKIALSFLEYALGRPATHYNLLTQNPISPLKKDKDIETGSGLFAGRIRYGGENLKPNIPNFITREALLKDDLLRIGYEDDTFHAIQKVTMTVPKKGRFVLQQQSKKDNFRKPEDINLKTYTSVNFKKGTPVFIVDRREKEVWQLIKELELEFNKYSSPDIRSQQQEVDKRLFYQNGNSDSKPNLSSSKRYSEIILYGYGYESKIKTQPKSGALVKSVSKTSYGKFSEPAADRRFLIEGGLWLSPSSIKRCSPKKIKDIWWFLPPVVWTSDEDIFYEAIHTVLSAGAKNFVLNMSWQMSCFNEDRLQKFRSDLNLWAGPFCNIANSAHISFLKSSGFSGAFVSPELGQNNLLSLPSQSPLPLGVIIKGNWPLAISRIVSDEIELSQLFLSPRGEGAWVEKRDKDFWVFPNWQLDLSNKQDSLKQAGYQLFLTIDEPYPKMVEMKSRPGLWNWETGLL
ncbi:MAG: peptidase U32 family protein [Desulfamplus sp.]